MAKYSGYIESVNNVYKTTNPLNSQIELKPINQFVTLTPNTINSRYYYNSGSMKTYEYEINNDNGAFRDTQSIMQATDRFLIQSATTIADEISRWQRENGHEDHTEINRLKKFLNAHEARLTGIAVLKNEIYSIPSIKKPF